MEKNILDNYLNSNYDKAGTDNLTKFMGFNQNIYVDPALNGFSFIFVTKPALFLYPQKPLVNDANKNIAYENMCIDPTLSMYIIGENTNNKDNILIKQLSYFDFPDTPSMFLPIFTNLVKGFTPMDLTLDVINSYQTREGYTIPTPTHTTASETASTISLPVSETDNLDFMKMMSIWINYIKNITNGTFSANPEMIKQNMLDYTCSIYYFVLGPDGRTLKYWCRYTSCFPTSVPYGSLSYQRGSIDHTMPDLTFQYTVKEDMNPRILEDFNMLSLKMVTPTFTNETYATFLLDTDSANAIGYTSFKDSDLLSKEKLFNGNYSKIVDADDRDPLIFFENGKNSNVVSDISNSKYVLSFGKDSISNAYIKSLLDNADSDFDYNEFIDKRGE